MSGAVRAFNEWWSEEYGDDYPTGTEFDQDDLASAYLAGWDAAMGAEWVTSEVPLLGIKGGEVIGPAHPGAFVREVREQR